MRVPHRWLLLALAAAALAGGDAAAVVTDVSPRPGTAAVSVGERGTLTVRWAVSRTGAAATVTSPAGRFIGPGGSVLATNNTPLSRANAGPGTTVLTEVVPVPRSVLQRAFDAGGGNILYQRTFSDGQASTGALRIALSGSGGGRFRVQHVSLRFDDDSTFRRVAQGTPLTAFADIRFAGAGQLEARWEIAGPASTLGNALFRPLRVVRRYLAGSRTVTLESPPLPADAAGGFILRFRITGPATPFEPARLRYFVFGAPDEVADLGAIDLAAPAPGARVDAETRFAWSAVAGAAHYQIEFFEEGRRGDPLAPLFGPGASQRPAAGIIVAGSDTETTVSPATVGRLAPGARYGWRVRAVGPDGRVLAASQPRPVRAP